jgi:uncharacterized protein (DUF608 family)
MKRRDFLKLSASTVGALSATGIGAASTATAETGGTGSAAASRRARGKSKYNTVYSGERLSRVAFPMGGIGAGMICLEGTGALSHFSVRNKPEVFNEPCVFAAVAVKGPGSVARVLEGPVPAWKLFGPANTGNGAPGKSYGLPRFRQAAFRARFPFATVTLADPAVPLAVDLTGWSPFEPGDADHASLPAAGLEYRFTNTGQADVEAVFSFNARNLMAIGAERNGARRIDRGFVLFQEGSR